MPHPSRIYSTDEELGKRDDDHKPTSSPTWQTPMRWRRRRILIGLAALFFVWLFVHNIPTDLGSIDERMGRPMRPGRAVDGLEFGYKPPAYNAGGQEGAAQGGQSTKAPVGAPPRSDDDIDPRSEHYYSGPIRFYNLASTLHATSRSRGHGTNNRNVLFAAASLKSASNLIPMACDMSRWGRNFVHVLIAGRESLSMADLLEINGVDPSTCNVGFHDGRPDYSDYSSDLRAEISVAGALSHVNTFLNFQVIITDDSAVEDIFFTKAVRGKAVELDRPVIEVPKGKYEDFLWMTRLDCSSLAAWHKPSINILVHAPPHSSGSLVRVLDSLKDADYDGLAPPQLTIDLPPDVEHFAHDHIRDMTWPPKSERSVGMPHRNTINLHHRISTAKVTTESNAMRLLEAFYPANPDHSHVLLLSAQAEVSALFYHYLMFHILEYRYSSSASYNSGHLSGLVLSHPQSYLNGSAPFVAPTIADMNGRKYGNGATSGDGSDEAVPFLWQAPNADAALIFGDKWAEFHDFLKNRLRAMHEPTSVHKAPLKPKKLIAETQPGWMEYMLELMRARGWSMLYPAARDSGSWATVHEELYQPPEEFSKESQPKEDGAEQEKPIPDPEEPFLSGDYVAPANPPKEQRHIVQHSQPLHALLPFDGDLPELTNMAAMSHSGDKTPIHVLQNNAPQYREELRQQVGGCTITQAGLERPRSSYKADDLFCFTDQDLDEEETSEVASPPSGGASTPDIPTEQSKEASAPKTEKPAAGEPALDSTAKQKQAYAKALGLSPEDTKDDVPAEEKQTKKAPTMKPIVEDLVPSKKKDSEKPEEEI